MLTVRPGPTAPPKPGLQPRTTVWSVLGGLVFTTALILAILTADDGPRPGCCVVRDGTIVEKTEP